VDIGSESFMASTEIPGILNSDSIRRIVTSKRERYKPASALKFTIMDQNDQNMGETTEETTAAPMTDMPVEDGATVVAPVVETAEDDSQPAEEEAAQ
jgi:hypothetical protein